MIFNTFLFYAFYSSIRVTVNCDLTQEQIKSSAAVLRKAEEVVLK